MCILFIAIKQHPNYPLIIAANRDEFHARATQSSHWWENTPNLLAGKDLEAGGTWMGISKSGNFAALTNIRDPKRLKKNAPSRGNLVLNAIQRDANDMQLELERTSDAYNGYNLLYGHISALRVYNNFENQLKALGEGVYGLSNAALNSPWPKTTKGMQALARYCRSDNDIVHEKLFNILRDDVKAQDHELPQTGVPYDWEKQLSSTFIIMPNYGTRSSTLLLVDNQDRATWKERTFNSSADLVSETTFEFSLEA